MLALRWTDLFFVCESGENVLELIVNHEDGLQVMDVLSVLPLGEDVHLWADGSRGDLGQLGGDVVSETPKGLDVD